MTAKMMAATASLFSRPVDVRAGTMGVLISVPPTSLVQASLAGPARRQNGPEVFSFGNSEWDTFGMTLARPDFQFSSVTRAPGPRRCCDGWESEFRVSGCRSCPGYRRNGPG